MRELWGGRNALGVARIAGDISQRLAHTEPVVVGKIGMRQQAGEFLVAKAHFDEGSAFLR